MQDDSLRTPPLIKRWQVLYDGVPETCLAPNVHYNFYKDTLAEGDNIRFACAIKNIGNYDMDSLLVKYWLLDNNRNIIPLINKRLRPHPIGDILSTLYIFRHKT